MGCRTRFGMPAPASAHACHRQSTEADDGRGARELVARPVTPRPQTLTRSARTRRVSAERGCSGRAPERCRSRAPENVRRLAAARVPEAPFSPLRSRALVGRRSTPRDASEFWPGARRGIHAALSRTARSAGRGPACRHRRAVIWRIEARAPRHLRTDWAPFVRHTDLRSKGLTVKALMV